MRPFLSQLVLIAILTHALPFANAVVADLPQSKKLIEFGWDEPDTAFIRAHLAELERTPFDGCVFHADAVGLDAKSVSFTWTGWGTRAFTRDELQKAVADLKATPFKRFTHNFLRFNTTPADVDWFDDYSAIVNNAKLAAQFATDTDCAGILFDTEQYTGKLFNYSAQRDAKTKSWDQYAAQVRKRGREVMQAFQAGDPNVTLFLTFGYTLPFRQCQGDRAKLAKAQYGLLVPFLDGMLDAASSNSRIIDGYESSYSFKDTTRFAPAYATMKSAVLPLVADPQKYQSHFSFGFGIWLDNNWRRLGWHTDDLSKNFYSPEAFEKTVEAALNRSDQYVWIYSETPKWWTASGKPDKLPDAYDLALRKAAGQ
ncbi:MAG TPA: hypothetical protein VIM11_21860 [Tepidisphaeraceae bacterium]|jgi:hypothetical protein